MNYGLEESVGSFVGSDLESEELREGVIGIFDVPEDEELGMVVNEAYKANNMAEALTAASENKWFYTINDLPRSVTKAVIVDGKFNF